MIWISALDGASTALYHVVYVLSIICRFIVLFTCFIFNYWNFRLSWSSCICNLFDCSMHESVLDNLKSCYNHPEPCFDCLKEYMKIWKQIINQIIKGLKNQIKPSVMAILADQTVNFKPSHWGITNNLQISECWSIHQWSFKHWWQTTGHCLEEMSKQLSIIWPLSCQFMSCSGRQGG